MATTTLFGNAVPDDPDVGPDDPVTLHSIVTPQKECSLTHIRFYKHAHNTGTHVGAVWELGNETPLATVTFIDETTDGWQEQELDTPLQLEAGHTYVIGVHMPNGHWSRSVSLLLDTASDDNEPVTFGMRFKVSEPVVIKGAAFARTRANIGWTDQTLTAKLWTNDGTELASGSLSDTLSWDGVATSNTRWAEIEFDTPVLIDADTIYVVSVHTPEGTYVPNGSAMGADYVRDIITLPGNTTEEPNCVYAYTEDLDVFPTNTFNSAYYGLDILIADYLFAPAFHGVRGDGFNYSGFITYPSITTPSSSRYLIDGVFSIEEGEPVGLVEETDEALPVRSLKSRALGLATELDSVFELTSRKSKRVGLALEFDAALQLLTGAAASRAERARRALMGYLGGR